MSPFSGCKSKDRRILFGRLSSKMRGGRRGKYFFDLVFKLKRGYPNNPKAQKQII